MAVWIDDFIPINQYSRPGNKLTARKKGILHFTANPGAPAKNHVTYFGKSLIEQNNKLPKDKQRYASAHIFVDKKEARCLIPLDEVAFAANDGNYRGVPELRPNANFLSISVEMCQEPDGAFHPDTIKRTEDVFVELSKMFNWDPLKDIVRHYDVTHKNCPAPWVSNPQEFVKFKERVKAKMLPSVDVTIVKNSEYVGKKLIVKNDGLWFYNTPRWEICDGTSDKGHTFTITEELIVDGRRMVKCHDGKYRTADPNFVDVTPKPLDWPYSVQVENITHKEAQEIVSMLQSKYKSAKIYGVPK
ncbi:N-acetylmuramoyl-L-alanine amidase family protein [Bacillus sp. 1P02SD]|uniref:peptidoglycan recognition protein family protein n=1 Tax=Bacillus sp. 1P02SD TaxID=3132264 RepID=UPI0039A1C01C